MRIVVDDYGAYISKKQNRFEIRSKEKQAEYSTDKVSQIIILKGSAISTDAIDLAMEKEIDIVCLNRIGKPFARIYPCTLGGTTLTRRNQLEAYFSGKGAALAKSFVRAKVRNQGYFLRVLGKTREDNATLNEISKEILQKAEYEIFKENHTSIDKIREQLLGIEGEASKRYYEALKEIIPEQFGFEGRNRRPPTDPFNAMLSYGYGVLYSEVEKACIISGLDPYLGFLHTDRYGKPSMVLDLIEEFRQPVVDRALITLIVRKQMGEEDFEREGEAVYLNKSGREKVIQALMERLETQITHEGKKLSLEDVILKHARSVVKYINGERKSYEPFIYMW